MTSISPLNFLGNTQPLSMSARKESTLSNATEQLGQLSDITPAMKGIKVNSLSADMVQFKKIISQFKYGKESLINNPGNFRVECDDKSFKLYGFHNSANSRDGICEELTHKAGLELEKQLGDKYIFVPVKGNYQKYNMQHYFLMAFERTKENESKVESMIHNCSKITQMAIKLMQQTTGDDFNFDLEKMQKLQAEVQELSPQPKMFKDAILIDPSFGLVEKFSEDGSIEGYMPNLITGFDEMNPYKNEPYELPIPPFMEFQQIPIGYAKDIAPELNLGNDAILLLNIEKDDDDLILSIFEMNPNDMLAEEVDISVLSDNHPLRKFLKTVK